MTGGEKQLETVSALQPRSVVRRRVPKTAAVSIKRSEGDPSYAELLRKARTKIRIGELGIENTRIRWSAGGAALIEVAGADNAEKADSLAVRLREVLQDEATISRPIIRGELHI